MSRREDGVAGVNIPMQEVIHRVVKGVPVIVQYTPCTPLWAHRRWRRFRGAR